MLNIGLVGCGVWGRNYIRNFEHRDDVTVAACCDFDEKNVSSAAKLMPSIKISNDPGEILNDKSLDALIIATPASTHYQIAMEGLNRGKHLLIEKPMTMTYQESLDLIELAAEKNKVLMVGHIMEYNPAITKLKEIIDSGEIGQIQYFYLTRTNFGRIRSDVNVLWDLAPHDLSIINYLLQMQPESISAKGACFLQESIEDVIFLNLEYGNGIMGAIHLSWMDPCKIRKVTVIGDKKMVVCDDLESIDKIRVYDKGISYNPTTEKSYEDFGSYQFSYRYGDIYIPQLELSEPLRNQCNHFIDCVKNNSIPRTDGHNGANVVRLLEAAQTSVKRRGETIDLDVNN